MLAYAAQTIPFRTCTDDSYVGMAILHTNTHTHTHTHTHTLLLHLSLYLSLSLSTYVLTRLLKTCSHLRYPNLPLCTCLRLSHAESAYSSPPATNFVAGTPAFYIGRLGAKRRRGVG
jgi:hypothetical protein